jgi:tRNA(fMet)-specific endonuclease VapC
LTVVLVDTNILSYSFKGDSRVEAYAHILEQDTVLYNFQTHAELLFWSVQRNWSERKKKELERFLEPYSLVPHAPETGHHWASAMHAARQAGRRMLSDDAWIAATALELGVPLVTHNKKDFMGVSNLEIISFSEEK